MPIDNISALLTPTEVTDIKAAFTTIKGILAGKLVNLTREERQSLYKLGNKRTAFVQQIMGYAEQYPELRPSFGNYPEAQKDYEYYLQMQTIMQICEPLTETIDDTMMTVGADLLQYCLLFYNNVKLAAASNVPGTTLIQERLKEFYDVTSGPEPETTPPAE